MKTTKLFSFATAALMLCAMLLGSCKREPKTEIADDTSEVPDLPEQIHDYAASSNDHLATLGRVLFYDKELSANKNISCGSCHRQENAFADAVRFSKGTNNGHTKRNSPAIFAKNGRVFWDGRSGSIRDLVLMPVKDEVEMNFPNIQSLVNRISKLDYYNFLFKNAFPGSATTIDSVKIKMALEEFVKNFSFNNNRFHQSQRGEVQLTESERLGNSLFMGKAQCGNCHHLQPNFSSNGYGVTDESHNIGLDETNSDLGVGAITRRSEENGEFMMPVLLNVALTAPYMHDGRFNTLEEVVEHYNEKVKANPNLDPILRENMNMNGPPRKLNLTETEKKGLVDFLKALTDPSVLTDARFSNPFVARP